VGVIGATAGGMTALPELQVFRPVVGLDGVDVMHLFARKEATPELPLHHDAMLELIAAEFLVPQLPITRRGEAAPGSSAAARAEPARAVVMRDE
jgi:hypothetical protein